MSQDLKTVWNNDSISVILRRTGAGEKNRIRLRGNKVRELGDYFWLRKLGRHKPTWIREKNYWETPKSWFNGFVEKSLHEDGSVYIVQPYRKQEKCSPACRNAVGFICQCSCMGENHGNGDSGGWFDVSETFSTRWGKSEVACRLLTKNK